MKMDITISLKEYRELQKDKARLDHLTAMAKKNNYEWAIMRFKHSLDGEYQDIRKVIDEANVNGLEV